LAANPTIILAPTVQTDLVALSITYRQLGSKILNRQPISELEWAEVINGTFKVINGVRDLAESSPQGPFAKAIKLGGASLVDVGIKATKVYSIYNEPDGLASIPIADILAVAAGFSSDSE
jgi:hypothetical protein